MKQISELNKTYERAPVVFIHFSELNGLNIGFHKKSCQQSKVSSLRFLIS